MLTFKERDDVTIQNPPADEAVLFYTDGALRLKDETGEVSTLATTEGLEAAAEATEPKVYVASLTQSGTNAPVATVLKNTLGGTVVWTRDGAGFYIGILSGAFPLNKVFLTGNVSSDDNSVFRWMPPYSYVSDSEIYIIVHDITDTRTDNNNISIKIEVYP